MIAVCEMAVLEEIRVNLKAVETISLNVTSDLMETQIFSTAGGLLGTVRDLVIAKWNESELPSSEGEHIGVVFVPNPIKIWYGGKLVQADAFAHLRVAIERYLGDLDEGQAAMLKGEGPAVEMPNLETGWQLIPAGENVDADINFQGIKSY